MRLSNCEATKEDLLHILHSPLFVSGEWAPPDPRSACASDLSSAKSIKSLAVESLS